MARPPVNSALTNAYILTHPRPPRGGGGGAGGDDDGGDGYGGNWGICPGPKDEPNVIARISGNSTSMYVELNGWSHLIPMKIFNIYTTTQYQRMDTGNGDLTPKAEAIKQQSISLREVEGMLHQNRGQGAINFPVYVHVVAKRKVDVAANREGRINMIPLLVVADNSGYCVLCSFNEGVATVYEGVDVGDVLLITRFLPQFTRIPYHRGLFSNQMFLDMELKIQYHTVRSHFLRKLNDRRLRDFQLPVGLFDDHNCVQKLPSELQEEFEAFGQPWVIPPGALYLYYDIVGVISHVGRVTRVRTAEPCNMDCLVNGQVVNQRVPKYMLFRYIHLIDMKSKPLVVQVILNNNHWANQDCLVPGALVVITHCTTREGHFSYNYVQTSSFSQIYTAGNIDKYHVLHPHPFNRKTATMMALDNYVATISRKDILWSAGGSEVVRILSEVNFFTHFTKKGSGNFYSEIDPAAPLARRESRRLTFEGRILRVLEIRDEDMPKMHYMHEDYETEVDRRNEFTVLENFWSYSFYKNCSWFSYARQLPEFDPKLFQEKKARDMVRKIVNSYKDYCTPLLLPAEMIDDKTLPPLAGFDRLDGPPYLMLDIVNEETRNWYTCIWKNYKYSHMERLEKVDAAKNAKISCLAEVHCVELDSPLELALHDFVVNRPELIQFNPNNIN